MRTVTVLLGAGLVHRHDSSFRPIAPVAAMLVVAAFGLVAACSDDRARRQVIERGAAIYAQQCAACHGARLEGQPDWRSRRPDGRLPAPPHDESGHTWHHSDDVLFAITKFGMVPPHAPPGYESDMPAFGGLLSDEDIRAVLSYIASQWKSSEVLQARAQMQRDAGRR